MWTWITVDLAAQPGGVKWLLMCLVASRISCELSLSGRQATQRVSRGKEGKEAGSSEVSCVCRLDAATGVFAPFELSDLKVCVLEI